MLGAWQFDALAGEIRALEARLHAVVAAATDADTWAGADADRFRHDWDTLVRARLLRAAAQVDAVRVLPPREAG